MRRPSSGREAWAHAGGNQGAGRAPALLCLLALAGCAAEAPPPSPRAVELVEIRPSAPELFAGQRVHLTALPTDRHGEDLGYRPTAWRSSDEEVATVTELGVLDAVSPGEARITATVEGVEGSVVVTVGPTPPGRVVLEPSSFELELRERRRVDARILDVLGREMPLQLLEWSSDDPDVATVDPTGRVEAVGAGETKVAARLGDVVGSASVRVLPAALDRLKPTVKEVSLYTGRQLTLAVQVLDVDDNVRPDVELTWVSDDPTVATVSRGGLVRAWSPGQTTITASILELEAKIDVTVLKMPVTRVEVEPAEIAGDPGGRVRLNAFVYGLDEPPIGGEPVTWSSSDEELATVDHRGEVSLLQRGKVEIRAEAGGHSGVSLVTIRRDPPINRIEIPTGMRLPIGESIQLSARVFDAEGAEILDQKLEWSSENPSIAAVDPVTGVAVGNEIGEVGISASADGVVGWTHAQVYLPFAIGEVRIVGDEGELVLGERRKFSTEVFDNQGEPFFFPAVNWSTSDESVAIVNPIGDVFAIDVGEVTLFAEVEGVVSSVDLEVVSIEFQSIQAKAKQICGLTTTEEIYCWGFMGLFSSQTAPAKLFGGGKFKDFGVGGSHVCAIDQTGKAYCAGSNVFGQVGDGTQNNSYDSFVPVSGGLEFQKIEAGGTMSCGITTEGKAYCWGWGGISHEPDLVFESLVPSLVSEELRFSSINLSPNANFSLVSDFVVTCGTTDGNNAYCWGTNDAGELGDGTKTPSLSPVAVGGGISFRSVAGATRAAGPGGPDSRISLGHSCGVSLGGHAYCWGANLSGELGIGTDAEVSLLPSQVAGDHRFQEIHVEAVRTRSLGVHNAIEATTCGLDVGGQVFCWGANSYLIPGDRQRSPVAIGGTARFKNLTLGTGFLCGIAMDDRAYCWGLNSDHLSSGYLGVYSQDQVVSEPTLVLGQPDGQGSGDGEGGGAR